LARSSSRSEAAVERRGLIGPFTGRQIATALAVLVGVALLLAALTAPIATPGATPAPEPGASFVAFGEAIEGLQPGQRAPELAGTIDGRTVELLDLNGRPIRLADLRGRPVWINFWATWCPPCQEETPTLQKIHERYADAGLALVAISVQESTVEDVRAYAETYGLTYTIGFDATSAVFTTYRAYGLPTQLFIDREGIVRATWNGPLSEEQAASFVEPLLAE